MDHVGSRGDSPREPHRGVGAGADSGRAKRANDAVVARDLTCCVGWASGDKAMEHVGSRGDGPRLTQQAAKATHGLRILEFE